MNCEWAQALTRYDCRPVKATDGSACLEIGTPFSLPDGSAINLYLVPSGTHIRISDNADTLFQLGGMGLNVWHAATLASLRELTVTNRLQLSEAGEFFALARPEHAAGVFALAITGLLSVSSWAAQRLGNESPHADLVAELQPYIIARNPNAKFERHPKIKGASRAVHTFDMQHGNDLIDVIGASATSTAHAMRKAGDVLNGPFAGDASPLIIVDDRTEPERAAQEIGILGSMTRAMAVTDVMRSLH